MKITRRNFVKISGLAAFAGIAMPNSILSQNLNGDILANQTVSSFRSLIGTTFYFLSEDVSTPAVLAKIQDFSTQNKSGECFSLTFEMRTKQSEQATYNVFHQKLGNFELFATEGKRGSLIAVINRV